MDRKKLYAFNLSPSEYGRVVRVLKQTGQQSKSVITDKARTAMKPGKRVTKWGTVYWETRPNRSDVNPSKRL